MLAGYTSLRRTLCKKTLRSSQAGCRALVLLVGLLCGWTYYVSTCLPYQSKREVNQLSNEKASLQVISTLPDCESTPEVNQLTVKDFKHIVTSSASNSDSKLVVNQLAEDKVKIHSIQSASDGESSSERDQLTVKKVGPHVTSNHLDNQSKPGVNPLVEKLRLHLTSSAPDSKALSEVEKRTDEIVSSLLTISPPGNESNQEVVRLKNDLPVKSSSPTDHYVLERVKNEKNDPPVTSSPPKDQPIAGVALMKEKDVSVASSPHQGQPVKDVDQVKRTDLPFPSNLSQGQALSEVVRLKDIDLRVTSDNPQGDSTIFKEQVKRNDSAITSSYSEDKLMPYVVRLTENNFNILVLSNSEPWLVEFYAPWCPHCRAFGDQYANIAERLWGIVHVGSVNIVEERELKMKFGVKSFPTLLVFHGNKNFPMHYSGRRVEDEVVNAVLGLVL